jgi:hypothetical protein
MDNSFDVQKDEHDFEIITFLGLGEFGFFR